MFNVEKVARKRRNGKKRRMSFGAKTAFVIEMMTKNAAELTLLRGVSGWGFNLTQIAEMTRYCRSTALLSDLLKMCDDGNLVLSQVPRVGSGVSDFEYWFYTQEEAAYALKRKKLL